MKELFIFNQNRKPGAAKFKYWIAWLLAEPRNDDSPPRHVWTCRARNVSDDPRGLRPKLRRGENKPENLIPTYHEYRNLSVLPLFLSEFIRFDKGVDIKPHPANKNLFNSVIVYFKINMIENN